jgi:L-amino acid N-acyltransferase YncA
MKPFLRMANEQDASTIRAIYGPFCENSVTSFEASAPPLEEMQARIRKTTAHYPWLVCVRDGEVRGYAYAGAHRERAAYRWSVDAAVYLAEGHRRIGMGRALYTALFKILELQGYFKVYAGITLPNPASVGLHEAMGFAPVGIYRGVCYKFGAWRDVGWWQLALQAERAEPAEPRGVRVVESSVDWQSALDAGAKLIRE